MLDVLLVTLETLLEFAFLLVPLVYLLGHSVQQPLVLGQVWVLGWLRLLHHRRKEHH